MFKKIILLCLIIFSANIIFALGTKKTLKHVIHYQLNVDTAKISVRNFNPDSLNTYQQLRDFNYADEKYQTTLWDRFWARVWHVWDNFWLWVGELMRKLFKNVSMGNHAASVIKYFILGLAAVGLVYLILKMIGIDILKIFGKKQQQAGLNYIESLENIHDINFDDAVEDALIVKNYRLAVRLLYLSCLKRLSDNNLINWKADKTNTVYLNELTDTELRSQFYIVTRQFEFVWYGNFPIDNQSFQNIYAAFQKFKQKLL